MVGIPTYIEKIKQLHRITNDYDLAKKLKVSQPEANWFRRGKKVPNPAVCIRMANLLKLNPVELLIVAQRDRANPDEKSHWDMALTAIDVMKNVPERPRYIPQKVKAISQELRQLENQILSYQGTIANNEAIQLLQSVESTVDSLMEHWQVWKRDGSLFPNYLMANQSAVKRGVNIRRIFVLQEEDAKNDARVGEFLQVLTDQSRAGVLVFFAFREELAQAVTFQRLEEEYRKQGVAENINCALFDEEILIFSRSYIEKPFDVNGVATPVTMIDRLDITWNPDHLRNLSPIQLFETRYVYDFRGERSFQIQLTRLKKTWSRKSR